MYSLSELYRYPVKSTAYESLESVRLDSLGLAGDRRWLVVEASNGRFLTQRLLPQMGRIEARWQDDFAALRLRAPGMDDLLVNVPGRDDNLRGVLIWRDMLQVPDAGEAAAQWLSTFLGRDVRLVQMPEQRARQVDTAYAEPGERVHFADGFPLLLIGQGSLDDLSAKVGRPLEMLRFRPIWWSLAPSLSPKMAGSASASATSPSRWPSPARAASSPPSTRIPASAMPPASRWRPCWAIATSMAKRCSART